MIWDLIIIQMNFKTIKMDKIMDFKILILEIIIMVLKISHFHHRMGKKLIHQYFKCFSEKALQIISIL